MDDDGKGLEEKTFHLPSIRRDAPPNHHLQQSQAHYQRGREWYSGAKRSRHGSDQEGKHFTIYIRLSTSEMFLQIRFNQLPLSTLRFSTTCEALRKTAGELWLLEEPQYGVVVGWWGCRSSDLVVPRWPLHSSRKED